MRRALLSLGIATLVASQAFWTSADARSLESQAHRSELFAAKRATAPSDAVIESMDGGIRLDAAAVAEHSRRDYLRGTPAPTLSVDGMVGNSLYSTVVGSPGAGNSTLSLPIGTGNSLIGIGWEVTVEAFGTSWRSEAQVAIVSQQGDSNGLFLRPLSESSPGVSTATSNGVLLFADVTPTPIPPIPADPAGNLYFEFHETFNDAGLNPDSEWSDSATPAVLPPGLRLICSDQAACDAAVGGGPAPELSLEMTVAPDNGDPAQCGTSDTVSPSVGDMVNFCYVVTNNTTETLEFHTLDDSIDGGIFENFPQTLAPGDDFQFNRMVTASSSAVHVGTWTAADVLPGYSADDSVPAGFIDISATGTNLNLTDDSTAGVTLPFTFDFYGTSTDQICVGNNGGIIVGTLACSVPFTNAALPAAAVGPAIFPFWDDLDEEQGGVFWEVQGTAPNRVAIVQWHQRPHFPGGAATETFTFQVQIFEDTGGVAFEYLDVDYGDPALNGGASATIGMQSAAGAVANQYSFNTASVADGDAILWTPTSPISFQATDSVTLDVGAPEITVDPAQIDAAADPGQSTTVNLAIGNEGNRDLEWSIHEAERAARGHFPAVPRSVAHKDPSDQSPLADPMLAEVAAKQALTGGERSSLRGTPAEVPAYSTTGFGITSYVSLDAANPGTLTTVSATQPTNVYAGEFIDNDFSRQFFIASSGGTLPANTYGWIDTATGAVTQLGLVTGGVGGTWTSLAWDGGTGTLFASSNAAGPGNQLYTVNPATGVATLVGPIAGPGLNPAPIIIAIAVAPSGEMYAIDIADDVLLAVDKTTGAASVIGATGVAANFAQDMDFNDATGELYWAAYLGGGNTRMQLVDTSTGATTEVGVIGSQAELLSFSIAVAGSGCAAPEDIPWLSVAPDSGTVAPADPDDIAVVTLDATGLSDDIYRANLCVSSNDPANGLVTVPVEFVVGNPPAEEADLGINLIDLPDPAQIGGNLSFIAQIANFGPREVEDALVEITLPAELSYVSGGLVEGGGTWSCSAAGQVVSCELTGGTLPAGGFAAALQIDTEVSDSASPGVVETFAEVSSTTWPDPNGANNVSSAQTTLEGEPDVIFANGFECAPGLPDCDGGGTPGIYTDRASFLQNVSPGFYEEDFADVPVGPAGPSLSFSGNGFAYTVTAVGAGSNNLFNDPGIISTDSAVDAILVTFTGAPVTAVGGNFWATDINVLPTGTDVTITLSDGTVETFTSTGPGDFRGFVTAAPITSIQIDAPDVPVNAWSTMDNLIVGD